MKWVKEALGSFRFTKCRLMMVRSSIIIFTGITRSDVAVGTSKLASIFSTILVATPLIFCCSPAGAGDLAFATGVEADWEEVSELAVGAVVFDGSDDVVAAPLPEA